jgi:glycosyltransferase involved in cell wall biosynthesis
MSDRVCAIIINFQTPDILRGAVESFRAFYPNVPVLIVDNGSRDTSPEVEREIRDRWPGVTTLLFLPKNIFHGPAMHRALQEVKHEYVLFIDSDTRTLMGGFIENMVRIFDTSSQIYGVGRFQTVNRRGFKSVQGISILLPAYMMLRKSLYEKFPSFCHHGMPVLKNFYTAQAQGYLLKEFPIENYIEHTWRGTASRYGYSLGVRGKIDFLLNKIGL